MLAFARLYYNLQEENNNNNNKLFSSIGRTDKLAIVEFLTKPYKRKEKSILSFMFLGLVVKAV